MKLHGTVSIAVGSLLASTASAQVTGPVVEETVASDTGNSGEIVVTAQRREEALSDIPISVTAANAESVQALGLDSVVDIAAITPGASFARNVGFFSPRIRGLGTDFVSVGLEAPVAVYEDGAYLTRTLTLNEILDNFDIDSIQVLRGPQGTLYGRNATGGVIIINSANPTSRLEGRVRAEYGRFDHRQLQGMINVPLGSDLAFRATGGYEHDDGYIRNLFTGKVTGGGRTYSARAKLRWQPGNADIVLGGQYYDTKQVIAPMAGLFRNDSTCLACTFVPGIAPSVGFYEQSNEVFLQPTRTKYYGGNLSMTFDAGPIEISSVTTYRKQDTVDSAGDSDGTSLPLFEFAVPRSGGRSYTQDFLVSSQLDGRLNYLFGLSYLNDEGFFNPSFLGIAFGGSLDPATAPGFANSATTKSYAAFLEGYYDLTDQLKITVGGRYTYEKRTAHGDTNAAFASLLRLPGAFSFDLSTTQRAFTPRFVLAWDNGPTNIYYSFTRGFKAGGFPGPFLFPVAPVLPEKIFSHEVGVKHAMLDNRLRLSAAAFYYKNKDQQSTTLDLNSGGAITTNAGAVENYGLEVEAQINPLDGLNLGLSGAWQHARYKPFDNASLACFDPTGLSNRQVPGATLYPCFLDVTGTPPPHAPDYTGSVNGSYEFPVGSWNAQLAGIVAYRSSILFQPGGGGDLNLDRDGSLITANASGFVSPPGDNLRIGFYVNNLFDRQYVTRIQTTQPYGITYNAAEPRTYGVRLEYRF